MTLMEDVTLRDAAGRLVEAGLIAEADNARLRLLQPKKLRQVADGLFPKL